MTYLDYWVLASSQPRRSHQGGYKSPDAVFQYGNPTGNEYGGIGNSEIPDLPAKIPPGVLSRETKAEFRKVYFTSPRLDDHWTKKRKKEKVKLSNVSFESLEVPILPSSEQPSAMLSVGKSGDSPHNGSADRLSFRRCFPPMPHNKSNGVR